MNGPLRQPVIPAQPQSPLWGLGFAIGVVVAWVASLLALLLAPRDTSWLASGLLLPALLLRTFLQTGLFIVGHDAMHGSLLPGSPRWNGRIGRLALALYAGLPWERCRANHRQHHATPAGPDDPDHHDGRHRSAPAWYLHFMATYLSPGQMAALLGSWLLALTLLAPLASHPLERLLLFWTLPLLLSSLQLFVIGTFLPHRQSRARSGDRHSAASLAWPPALSLLACFHFGYHWEHHENPQLPWYRLPEQRRLVTVPRPGSASLAIPQVSR